MHLICPIRGKEMYSLNDIGFLEITDNRLESIDSGMHYLEFAITSKCNFDCSYCNKMTDEDLSIFEIDVLFQKLARENLQFVQFTGGEPLIRKDLIEIVTLAKSYGFRCGISSNGSFPLTKYFDLIDAGVELFSISLDTNTDMLSGQRNLFQVANVIKEVSERVYTNVGMVISEETIGKEQEIIEYIISLGAHDVKISTDSHKSFILPHLTKRYGKPILDYRLEKFSKQEDMRGCGADVKKCFLVKNDISVKGNKHYPCLVYAREGGEAIGLIDGDIKSQRIEWFNETKVSEDPICSKYCMDFKVDFNRRAFLRESI